MQLRPNFIVLLFCSLMFAFSVTSMTIAQTDSDSADESEVEPVDERLETMLEQRQKQIEQRLRSLTRAEASMGDNHPSIEKVRKQIQELELEIETWSSPRESLLDMTDGELRAMVLQLSIRVDRLERRTGTSAGGPSQAQGMNRPFGGRR